MDLITASFFLKKLLVSSITTGESAAIPIRLTIIMQEIATSAMIQTLSTWNERADRDHHDIKHLKPLHFRERPKRYSTALSPQLTRPKWWCKQRGSAR